MTTRTQRRSALLRANGGSHSAAEWEGLKARFGWRCLACGRKGTKRNPLTKDHVVPLSRGGTDDIENLQPLHRACNSAKGTRVVDYRIRWVVQERAITLDLDMQLLKDLLGIEI